MLQASAAPAEEDVTEGDAAGKALEEAAEREAVATLRKSQEAAKDRESGEEVSAVLLSSWTPMHLTII